jgi:hypothetical protein
VLTQLIGEQTVHDTWVKFILMTCKSHLDASRKLIHALDEEADNSNVKYSGNHMAELVANLVEDFSAQLVKFHKVMIPVMIKSNVNHWCTLGDDETNKILDFWDSETIFNLRMTCKALRRACEKRLEEAIRLD